jgi:hypothetical protein
MNRSTNEIIKEAARVLARQEKLRKETREIEQRVRELCLEYGSAERCWGVAPHHLRQAVESRTQKRIAA